MSHIDAGCKMAMQIKTWQIVDGKLSPLEVSLSDHGRREAQDLENWIASQPSILGPDIVLIGRQVSTKSGPLDLLGIDKAGNTVVVELKRDRLPREALAQAIDYASDIADWPTERLSEECNKYTGKSLDEVLSETFDDLDLESVNVNDTQRILLVGFAIDSSLERMIEWLSGYEVSVNAIVLQYVRTSSGDELLTKTAIISEEIERERIQRRRFRIPMSDEPGNYDDTRLRELLRSYLSQDLYTSHRIRDILLPACLERERISREQLVQEFLRHDEEATDPSMAGKFVSLISSQIGMEKNAFLRQVIGYEYPDYPWQKDNYHIRRPYADLVREVLNELKATASSGAGE